MKMERKKIEVQDILSFFKRLGIDLSELGINLDQYFEIVNSVVGNNPELKGDCGVEIIRHNTWANQQEGLGYIHSYRQDKESNSVSQIEINSSLYDKTFAEIGEKKFKNLLNSLEILGVVVNHDYTMHQAGFYFGTKTNKFINENLIVPSNNLTETDFEVVAAVLHKVIVDKIFKSKLFERKYNMIISRIFTSLKDLPPEIKQKWYSVLKYFVWSVVDPDSVLGQAIIKKGFLGEGFKGMSPGEWAEICNTKSFDLKKGGQISVEDLFNDLYLKQELTN